MYRKHKGSVLECDGFDLTKIRLSSYEENGKGRIPKTPKMKAKSKTEGSAPGPHKSHRHLHSRETFLREVDGA